MSTVPWQGEISVSDESAEVDVGILGLTPAALGAALVLVESGTRVGLVSLPGDTLAYSPGISLPCTPEHYWVMVEGVGRAQAALWWGMAQRGAIELRAALERADCPHASGALLQLATNQTELDEMSRGLDWLTEDGWAARMMGPAAASNFAPVDEMEGALYLPGATVFDPLQAASHLLGYLRSRGVVVSHRLPVCEVQLITAGPLLRGVSAIALRGQAAVYEPLPQGFRAGVVAMSANRCHEFYRTLGEEQLLVAGLNPGATESVDAPEVDLVFLERLRAQAVLRVPDVGEAEMVRAFAVLILQSADGVPLVGTWPGQSGRFVAGAFGVADWSLGFGAGRLVGHSILGHSTPLRELTSGSLRRFMRG